MIVKSNPTRVVTGLWRGALLLTALLCFGSSAFAQTQGDAEPDPTALFEQGQNSHARGDYAAALRFYEAALKAHTEFPEAEYQRGSALVSLKRLPEAVLAFRRALELRPEWTLPRLALGTALADTGRDRDAATELQKVLEAEPTNALVLSQLAMLRARQNDKQGSLALLRRATALPSASESAWLARASAEQEAGNSSEALSAVTRALELNPRNTAAKLRRADLLLDANDAAQAIETVRSIEQDITASSTSTNTQPTANLNAQLASVYSRLGVSLRLKEPRQSLAYFRRAVELDPQNADYATGYAAALVQERRFGEAVEILRRVIAAAPDNYAAHANLAAALDELKRYDEALVEYRWLRARKPELAITDFFIARALDLLEQYAEALAAYESFVKRADTAQHSLEIEKVNLRLPTLRKQAQRMANKGKGK